MTPLALLPLAFLLLTDYLLILGATILATLAATLVAR